MQKKIAPVFPALKTEVPCIIYIFYIREIDELLKISIPWDWIIIFVSGLSCIAAVCIFMEWWHLGDSEYDDNYGSN